jgi:hypothetical protein
MVEVLPEKMNPKMKTSFPEEKILQESLEALWINIPISSGF